MTPGERFKIWIDSLSEAWKDKLRGWMLRWVAEGIAKLFENMEDEAEPLAQDFIDKFPLHPSVKADLQAFMSQRRPIAIPAFAAMAIGVVVGSIVGTFMGWAQPIAKWTSYQGEKIIKSWRLDPAAVITAWRRDKPKYESYFQDLKDQGWSDDRIEALKFFTEFLPSASEQTLWLAREVFEPDMVTKYGLHDEMPGYEDTDFAKIGVSPDQMKNIWAAHWEHASFMQMVEMLHRGLITEADFSEWFKLVEIVPFWRDKLIKTVYTWPTRVDVRRWWDMRTIDEAELRRLYSGMGYRGDNLENYLLWTKVYTAFPDLMARWKKGWITIDDVRSELTGLGMPADRVEEMIQTKIEPEKGGRVAGERDLTKTDIIKGVKKGVITRAEGIELLMDLGYDEDEADYILTINIEAMEGSPENMQEFRAITQQYRKAVGLPSKLITEELKKAATELVRITTEVANLATAVEAEKKTLIDSDVLPEAATEKLTELQLSLHRAQAEFSRVQTDYNALVSQWRHKRAE